VPDMDALPSPHRASPNKNPHFIPTDGTTGHSTKLPKDGNLVAGYAALWQRGKQAGRAADARKKFLAYISTTMWRGKTKFQSRVTFRLAGTKILPAPCIWANSEF
jgi:hypothetical protein